MYSMGDARFNAVIIKFNVIDSENQVGPKRNPPIWGDHRVTSFKGSFVMFTFASFSQNERW